MKHEAAQKLALCSTWKKNSVCTCDQFNTILISMFMHPKVHLSLKQVYHINTLRSSGSFVYHQAEQSKTFYLLPPLCIYVLFIDPVTNSDYFAVQHKMIAFL
jgi:hypothetical protein